MEDFYLQVGPVCQEDDAEWHQREPERGRLRAAMDDAHRAMTGASITLELEAPPGLVSEVEDLNTAALNVFVMGFMRNYAASEATWRRGSTTCNISGPCCRRWSGSPERRRLT
ncbi:hypothetical protein [Streptomyces cadmiisoli]|uniref:hypothetical protein n=1 Tax=Streptomyces cadmiisoli TaxID=2184053 RepID=UPI00366868C5